MKNEPIKSDWWNNLSENHKRGIERGLKDIAEGRLTPHEKVLEKYGLKKTRKHKH